MQSSADSGAGRFDHPARRFCRLCLSRHGLSKDSVQSSMAGRPPEAPEAAQAGGQGDAGKRRLPVWVGDVQFSAEHAYLPVCLDGVRATCCLLGTSVMHDGSDIPLLLSLPLIERKLQAVLDFPKGCARLGAFQAEVPIVKINGHICISISEFPSIKDREPWSMLSNLLDQGHSDAEFVCPSPSLAATALHGDEPTSPFVASSMARVGSPALRGRDDLRQVPGPDRPFGDSQPKLAVAPGPDAPGDGRRCDPGSKQALPTSPGAAGQARQPVRKVLPVHPVRNKVETQRQGDGRGGQRLRLVWSKTFESRRADMDYKSPPRHAADL